MEDEKKTKKVLISELIELRHKYAKLKAFLGNRQDFKTVDGKETILVVDDNESTRKVIVAMLETYGYTLIEADSSQKAIAVFKSHGTPIHLVLSDVVMPEINGPEMVEKLVGMQSDVKVVFMSGYTEDDIIHDDVNKILHSQTPFIQKPFPFQEIGRIIRQQLDGKL